MAPDLYYPVAVVIGFLIGGIPTGVIVSRRKFGIDVREIGSGNIGATNVTRAFGWRAGILVFGVDLLKGFLPVHFALLLFSDDVAITVCLGVSLVLGHCYSPFLKFKGGKGVATSLGCVAAVLPIGAAIAAGVYALVLAITRISALGSLAGVVTIIIYTYIAAPPRPIAIFVGLIAIIVIGRHTSNIARLLSSSNKGAPSAK
ncbi:MAG: glycerol-3-phosphate 1-O-acyltransferase PlsY [Deltaproteobacteria bacterium]|nr:glycerol-3-phosphate 1-O-acyltransferase PlsY [Deltaproteobacteria bacterium]MBI3293637.1 glycerol-3-phosphate 1-O-acyltransferase PlsY [Deltaproteobacteria bacterium]